MESSSKFSPIPAKRRKEDDQEEKIATTKVGPELAQTSGKEEEEKLKCLRRRLFGPDNPNNFHSILPNWGLKSTDRTLLENEPPPADTLIDHFLSLIETELEWIEDGQEMPENVSQLLRSIDSFWPTNFTSFRGSANAMRKIGEYFERKRRFLVANSFYRRALALEPSNEVAKNGYDKTLAAVEQQDQCLLQRVAEKRQGLCQHLQAASGNEQRQQQIRVHLRAAFYEHTYQTCRMEDNPTPFEEVYKLLTAAGEGGGSSKSELFWSHDELEIKGAARGFVQTLLGLNGGNEFTEELFYELHRILMEDVDPEIAGKIVRPEVERKEREEGVKKMIQWMNSEIEAKQLDPATFAALAHFYVVELHVFPDGNGRLCRLWMNRLLMLLGFPPISISADTEQQKQKYFALLCAGTNGDLHPFVRFIAQILLDTMEKLMQAPTEEQQKMERPRADLLSPMLDSLLRLSSLGSPTPISMAPTSSGSSDISINWAHLFRLALIKDE